MNVAARAGRSFLPRLAEAFDPVRHVFRKQVGAHRLQQLEAVPHARLQLLRRERLEQRRHPQVREQHDCFGHLARLVGRNGAVFHSLPDNRLDVARHHVLKDRAVHHAEQARVAHRVGVDRHLRRELHLRAARRRVEHRLEFFYARHRPIGNDFVVAPEGGGVRPVEGGVQDLLLGSEMVVDGAFRETVEIVDDVLDRRLLVSLLEEKPHRRVEYPGNRLLGVLVA